MLAAAREALSVRPSLGAAVGNNITEVERTWTEKKVGEGKTAAAFSEGGICLIHSLFFGGGGGGSFFKVRTR